MGNTIFWTANVDRGWVESRILGKKRSNNRYLHACSVGFCFLVCLCFVSKKEVWKETFQQSLSSCLFCWFLFPCVFVFRVEERSLPKNPAITKWKSFVHSIYIKFIKSSIQERRIVRFSIIFSFHT